MGVTAGVMLFLCVLWVPPTCGQEVIPSALSRGAEACALGSNLPEVSSRPSTLWVVKAIKWEDGGQPLEPSRSQPVATLAGRGWRPEAINSQWSCPAGAGNIPGLNPDKRQGSPVDSAQPQRAVKESGFRWGAAVAQSTLFTSVMHVYRITTEPSTRDELREPFFKDYLASLKGLRGWRDGDEFYVNYVGHPMQGAVSGFIQIHNDPSGVNEQVGRDKNYWRSRLKALGWSALVSIQFEIGPLSEASLGNVGMRPSEKSKHPMAYVDLVVTPTVGTAWLVGEDALDRYLIRKIEGKTDNRVLRALVRGFLNPSRSFANLMRFKPAWYRDGRSL